MNDIIKEAFPELTHEQILEILATFDRWYEPRTMSAEDYHADPAIGASMLEDFYKSRRLYEGRCVSQKFPRKKQTAAMELGRKVVRKDGAK